LQTQINNGLKIILVKQFNSLDTFSSIKNKPTVVTIGSFDGVHKGHQQVLQQLKNLAQKYDMDSVVISFDPHPRIFFNPDTDLRLLTTNAEKAGLLNQQGVDYFVLQPFDNDFANQDPETFIRRLVNDLNMKHLLIGYDHHFGKNRSGNYDFIKTLEPKYGFTTHKIEAVKMNDVDLSSTKIRKALQDGDIELANSYLGYPYFFTGKVVKGNQLGRKLGFPTANIEIEDAYKLIPKQGVYIVKSVFDGKPVYGMMNIGYRPTIDGKKQIIEVHFFDFDKDIYEQPIRISFLKRLRDEQKFPSLEALKAQLKNDRKNALSYLEQLNKDVDNQQDKQDRK